MRKIVIVYGLIAGAIVTILLLFWMFLWEKGIVNFDNGEYFGYGSMVLALSMIFFGIKSFRDDQIGKSIGFWKGVQIGMLISLVASVVYATGWEVYFQANPEVRTSCIDKYTEHYIGKLEARAAPPDEIDRTRNEMAAFAEMYKNPLIRFGMTLAEILPVGILVTFLSASILRRKEVLVE